MAGDELRAADVFKVFVETNTSMRQVLDTNTKALTETVAAVRALEQSNRDQANAIRVVHDFIDDQSRSRDSAEKSSLLAIEKITMDVQKRHEESIKKIMEESEARYKKIADDNSNSHVRVIYWLIGLVVLLVAAILGLAGKQFATPPLPKASLVSPPTP